MSEGQIMSFGFVLISVLVVVEIFSHMKLKAANYYHQELLSKGYVKMVVTTAEEDHVVWIHSSMLEIYAATQGALNEVTEFKAEETT
jgi:hypothetical protein